MADPARPARSIRLVRPPTIDGVGVLSVSVVTAEGAVSDALSTAFLVGGLEAARRYCASYPQTLALVTPDDGTQRPIILGAFTGARPVATAAVRVSPEAMRQAQAVNAMDVRPARESYMGRPAQPGVRFGAPPAQVAARQVVVKQAPPASVRPSR